MKLKIGDKIRVDGFVMLKKLDTGVFRVASVKKVNNLWAYYFAKGRGKKVVIGHYADSVDQWIVGDGNPDLNKIVKL